MIKLSTDKAKMDIIRRKLRGDSSRKIGKDTGLGKTTINEFITAETHREWWLDQLSMSEEV